MPRPHFKNPLYRRVAPAAFRLLRKSVALSNHRESDEVISARASELWDRFVLNPLFAREVRRHTAYEHWTQDRVPRDKDEVFILGCGPSVAKVTQAQWTYLSGQDTIALNFFIAHDFVPRVLITEVGTAPGYADYFTTRLAQPQYKDTRVLVNERYCLSLETYPLQGRDKTAVYSTICSPTRDRDELRGFLARHYAPASPRAPLVHYASILDTALNLAVRKGYRKIWLVGVDLNDDGYFWDAEPERFRQFRSMWSNAFSHCVSEIDRRIALRPKGSVHITADRVFSGNRLDIVAYVDVVNECQLRPRGVQVVMTNRASLLAQVFPHAELPS